MKKFAAVLMTVVASFIAVARGGTLCFCDEDPDGCGHACHECGASHPDGISAVDPCAHLEVAAGDLMVDDGCVPLPIVHLVPPVFPDLFVWAFFGHEVVPRATSPPSRLQSYSSYSARLFPRS